MIGVRSLRRTAVVLALVGVSSCTPDDGTTVIKLGHALGPGHPVHLGMVHMADRLVDLSNGTMRIEMYPSQQLCSERECMELLQIGSLGMTKVSAAIMENFAPSYRVLSLPYLFRDEEHRFRVLRGEVGQQLLRDGEPKRLLGLAFYDAGSRSFYTRDRPVRTPADLRGLKIRVLESTTAMRMVSALGGSPAPIAWGELYTALQQGVVDGAENNLPSFYTSRHYEVSRYFIADEHTSIPDVLVISTVVWDRLTPQERVWLRTAAEESAEVQKGLWAEATQEALEAIQEAGVTVIHPDKDLFVEQVQPMVESYRDDPLIGPLIRQIQAVGSDR